MTCTIPASQKILILEDQRIVGFDLERQLKKNGFSVMYHKSYEDVINGMQNELPQIIISSVKELENNKLENGFSVELNEADTSTLVIQQQSGIRSFEKPYNIEDIISFIESLTTK